MMYHGTITRIYGLDIAIQAFALNHTQMPGAELWILGGGPEIASLKTMSEHAGLNSKVKFVGLVPSAEIPGWLKRADVGILPLRRDVFLDFASPNKLAEYIVSDKPVIISRLNSIQHYFSDDALAYFEPNHPRDLAMQMVRLYSDAGLRTRLADRARQEYAPNSWSVMKQRYLQLMNEMTGLAGYHPETSRLAETAGAPQ
jgi:glycosyltransferase involved in cell wall biosynthesis